MRTLVLFSGGLDSAVSLLMAGPHPVALSFDYGQPHAIELRHADAFCQGRGIEHWNVPLRLAGGGLLDGPGASPVIPGRNLAMLSVANSYAVRLGCERIWIGVTAEDHELFPDCRAGFINAVNAVTDVPVEAPMIHMKKPEIHALAEECGIAPDETWSCYFPVNDKACGRCGACEVRG